MNENITDLLYSPLRQAFLRTYFANSDDMLLNLRHGHHDLIRGALLNLLLRHQPHNIFMTHEKNLIKLIPCALKNALLRYRHIHRLLLVHSEKRSWGKFMISSRISFITCAPQLSRPRPGPSTRPARHYLFLNFIARINKSILDARRTLPILNFKFEKDDFAKQNFQLQMRRAIATDNFLKRIVMTDVNSTQAELAFSKHVTGVVEVATKRNGN